MKRDTKINVVCQLCLDDLKKEKVYYYIGGYIHYAHESCLEIAEKAIRLYSDYLWLNKLINDSRKK